MSSNLEWFAPHMLTCLGYHFFQKGHQEREDSEPSRTTTNTCGLETMHAWFHWNGPSISEVLGLVCWWLENVFTCQTDEFQEYEQMAKYNEKIHQRPCTLIGSVCFCCHFMTPGLPECFIGWVTMSKPLQLVFMMLANPVDFGADEQQLNLLTIILSRSTTCTAPCNATENTDCSAPFSHCCRLAGGSGPGLPKNLRQRVKKEGSNNLYSYVFKICMQMYAHLKHVQKILSNSLQSPLKFHGSAFARSLYILTNVKCICHLSFPSHKTKQNLPWRWGNRLPPTKPSLLSAPAQARFPTEISAWHRHLATVPSGNKGPPPCQIPWPLASDRPSTLTLQYYLWTSK